MASHQLPWKTAWITGAGKGIGRALAQALCERGVTVYASSRTLDDLMALANDCFDLTGSVVPCPLDITDKEAVVGLIHRFGDDLAFPDLTVLNAGTHFPTPVLEASVDDVDAIMRVNYLGTVNCFLPLVQSFKAAGHRGQVAVVASVAGYRGLKTAAAYGASKAALINFCEAAKPELDEHGTSLHLVNPGFVRTPLTDKNTFEMPHLVEPEDAARFMIDGLEARSFEVSFPRAFVRQLKLMRLLPYRWFFPLIKKATQ
ncbi:MAG: SDR family NAD(P)-dependent oxidoreductase [Pontibacterium sp.]